MSYVLKGKCHVFHCVIIVARNVLVCTWQVYNGDLFCLNVFVYNYLNNFAGNYESIIYVPQLKVVLTFSISLSLLILKSLTLFILLNLPA